MRSTFALSVTDSRSASSAAEREVALQWKLEQPLANRGRPFGLHREDAMRDARTDRRSEESRPLERWPRTATSCAKRLFADRLEQRPRFARALLRTRCARWPRRCHSEKKRSHSSCRKRPRSSGVRVSSSSGCSSSRSTSDAKNRNGQSRYRSRRLTDTRGSATGRPSPRNRSSADRQVATSAPAHGRERCGQHSGRRGSSASASAQRHANRRRIGRFAARRAARFGTSSSSIDGSTTASFSSGTSTAARGPAPTSADP